MSESKKNGVLVQAGILAAASMIVRIIGLLYRAPLTAIIGDEGNGYYGTAYNIYTIILMVSSYSMPSAISKLMAQKIAVGEYKNAQRIFHCALFYGLGVGIIGSALLWFGAGLLVPAVAVCVLRIFAPIIFLFGILGALRGYFQAQGSMVQTSLSQILEQLANAAVSIGAAWLLMHMAAGADTTRKAQLGAMGSALGTGAGVLSAMLLMYYFYLRFRPVMRENIESDCSQKRDSWASAMKATIFVITPFMLSGFILNLTTSLNQTIFYKIMIGEGFMKEIAATTVYGIFSNKAVVISNIPISIATAVSSAIIPGISASYARGDIEDTRRRVSNASKVTAVITIPAFVGLAVLAKQVTMIMFPQMESLELAGRLLSMLSITVVLYSISTITNAALQSIGKMNMPLVSAGIALAVQTIVLVLLLRYTSLGIYALVIVSIVYSAMIFVCNEFFLKKYLGIRRDVRTMYSGPLGCSIVMGIAAIVVSDGLAVLLPKTGMRLYFQNFIATCAALVVAVVVYGFLLVRTHVMSKEDLLALPKGGKIVRVMERLHWFG
ncbi:MAG: polysaccharide biosynthesis protein [Lachnospiraceae bacterium]|nr:polysaccharide biosynthesis protein [Lachnospiraceae bacterium]